MNARPDSDWLDEPHWAEMLPEPRDADSAHEHWLEIVAEMRAQQKLANVNGHAISRLVVARIIYERCARTIMREGEIVHAPKTGVPMQHPALSIMNKQAEIAAQLEAELTLSPRKRATGGKVAAKKSARAAGTVEL